jgi:cytochrome P450
VLYLLEHPQLLATVRQRPELLGRTVEELLRLCPAVNHSMSRVAVRDTELGGAGLAAGTTVTACLPAANRDERAFARPCDPVVDREVRQHLTFGRGIHYCLGAQLARIEIRAALLILLDRLPGLHLATPPSRLRPFVTQGACGSHDLPVGW